MTNNSRIVEEGFHGDLDQCILIVDELEVVADLWKSTGSKVLGKLSAAISVAGALLAIWYVHSAFTMMWQVRKAVSEPFRIICGDTALSLETS